VVWCALLFSVTRARPERGASERLSVSSVERGAWSVGVERGDPPSSALRSDAPHAPAARTPALGQQKRRGKIVEQGSGGSVQTVWFPERVSLVAVCHSAGKIFRSNQFGRFVRRHH
jgi:hypothetical protein